MSLPFLPITTNEYVSRPKITLDSEDIDVCDCRTRAPDDDTAICNDETCWNRMSHVECKRCVKSRCANQRLRQGKWAQLERFKVLPVVVEFVLACFRENHCFGHVWLPAKSLVDPQTGTKKEYGLRTKQALKKGDFVVEYVGEVIDDDEFRLRLQEYTVRRVNAC